MLARYVRSLEAASLYRSDAVSAIAQPPYLNTALCGITTAPPAVLLAIAKALEHAAGRRAGPREGPRPLDIDLLLYGDEVRCDPELTLPHPRLRARRFALAPLAELEPDWPVPPDGRTVGELLGDLDAMPDLACLGRWLPDLEVAPPPHAPARRPVR